MSKTKESSLKKYKTIIESSDDSINTKNFKRLLNLYLENLTKFTEKTVPEFEVRFATKGNKKITKIEFYNVIKNLIQNGFKLENENYSLKIIPDKSVSNIRTELIGFPNIQNYCKYNSITSIEDITNVNYIEKEYFRNDERTFYPIDFDDYNFRISYNIENVYFKNDKKVEDLQDMWNTTKKVFRYIKRFEYKHPNFPLNIHLSIVKTSRAVAGKMISEFNIKESEVFNSLENFEIEIEIDNTKIGMDSKFETGTYLYDLIKKAIKYVMIGIQETNFPISYIEQNKIGNNYLKLVKGETYSKDISVKDFIGPSSVTLQMIHLLKNEDTTLNTNTISNIRNNYTVTDKADGLRKLLYINNDGRIYLITTSMNVQFTGTFTNEKELFNTIIDGEHILINKKNEYINLFACFDIYIVNGKNVTGLPFINITNQIEELKQSVDGSEASKVKKDNDTNYRLVILNSVIKKLNINSIIPNKKPSLNINIKKFYANNIFNGCATIINNEKTGLYDYNTDGIIFTPANTGVASKTTGVIAPNFKVTWTDSFKWKPPEFNTIDFLVKFKKNEFGKNLVGNIYNSGMNMETNNQINQYYTLILHVGFNEKQHGYINPCNDIINNVKNKSRNIESDYKPARFYPTNPSDNDAGICNIVGVPDDSGSLKIYTLEGEEIEDNTIVEFKYDSTKENNYKWLPLRVRYDKTSELRSGVKNFGNAYHVANSTWQSIHNPITEKIITSGENIIIDNNDDDVYYNKVNNKTHTRPLRDFHNLYVKNILVKNISRPGYTLIDYACGKGGDIPKWINSSLNFVLGIDLAKDNIENRLDGACARYLNYSSKYTSMPSALFLHGNSSANIKDGSALYNEKNKNIIKALFGEGSKNELSLGRAVYENYGIVKSGFNISSIQFALHYMFENVNILNEFVKNLSQCTSVNGYFIGCCYDGTRVFNMLKQTKYGESITLFKDSNKIWQITKQYESNEFLEDDSCMGYAIDIYQESINKTFREYLVNFNYLIRVLENYGFTLLEETEYKDLNLPGSIGTFQELFNNMNLEVKKDRRLQNKVGTALNMSDEEKKISFLNNYFIFKKIRSVDNVISEGIKEKEEEYKKELDTKINLFASEVDKSESELLQEKSKKLAAEFLKTEDAKMKTSQKGKPLTIDEKIKLAEDKKKQRELEKKLLKEEKEKLKQQKKSESVLKSKTKK
tara:strand:- start:1252 stop:4833 length:3582 start_codon:yes stop_codon:yes gene_type:complete